MWWGVKASAGRDGLLLDYGDWTAADAEQCRPARVPRPRPIGAHGGPSFSLYIHISPPLAPGPAGPPLLFKCRGLRRQQGRAEVPDPARAACPPGYLGAPGRVGGALFPPFPPVRPEHSPRQGRAGHRRCKQGAAVRVQSSTKGLTDLAQGRRLGRRGRKSQTIQFPVCRINALTHMAGPGRRRLALPPRRALATWA